MFLTVANLSYDLVEIFLLFNFGSQLYFYSVGFSFLGNIT